MTERVLHKGLTPERWNQFSIQQRLQMIESEFLRAAGLLKEIGDRSSARRCYFRAKELIAWTLGGSSSKQGSAPVEALLQSALKATEEESLETGELAILVAQSEELARSLSRASRDSQLVPR